MMFMRRPSLFAPIALTCLMFAGLHADDETYTQYEDASPDSCQNSILKHLGLNDDVATTTDLEDNSIYIESHSSQNSLLVQNGDNKAPPQPQKASFCGTSKRPIRI